MEQVISMCEWSKSSYLIFSDNVFAPLIYYSHFFALGVSFFVGLFIYLQGRKELVNNLLFIISISLSVWIFGDLVLWASEKPSLVMFFWSLVNIFEPLVYLFSLYFFLVFIDKKDISLGKKTIMAGLMIPILVFASTKLSLLGFDLSNCDRAAVEGPMAQYGYLLELFFVCWIIIAAIIRYKKSKEPDFRSQIVIMSSALCIFLLSFSLGNIVEVFTDNWGVGQIGLIGVPVFIAFLSYLIVRYKAFSIKLMGAQALVMVLGFLVLSLLFVRTLEDARYVILGTFIIVLVVGYLLVRSVKREIEQRHRLQDLTLSLEKSNLSLAEANDKLKGLDKLKTEFLSLASHQLRSPLTAIKGYASMLSEGAFGSLDSKQDEAIKRIYTSAQGLTNIVEDLLNVSKIEQGGMKYEFSPTSLSAIVTTLYNEMKVPAESKSLEFSLEMDSHDQYIVSADATKIKQVFLNLVDNSIKYTPKGFVKIFLKREGANIVFSVLDSGMGISPETRAKLFEKFSRGEGGKTNTGGSGLGLYLAQQIARAHKGDVTIESPGLGKGSTFIVTLPASGSYPN